VIGTGKERLNLSVSASWPSKPQNPKTPKPQFSSFEIFDLRGLI
jgi:hypothetical protein